jgi:hypothetical protein
MAHLKKNQMNQIIFPNVDGVDFATIESGITASDFESKMTKKFFGVNHGGSVAFTSGTISKAATLVRSGLMQQTLKAAECNYDYVIFSFAPANTSLAQQILAFQTVTNDDADIISRLSDIGSDLRSYMVGLSASISDIDSQLLLNASMISDADSQALLNASMISDVQSALDSQFTYLSAAISDIASAVWANVTRTLTQGAASVTAAVSGSTITVYRGTTWSISLTGLGDISTYDTIYFSVKENVTVLENDAILRVKDDASGLERFNKAAPVAAGNGTITIDDAGAGNITITIQEAETKFSPLVSKYDYDVKGIDDDGNVDLISIGIDKFTISGEVTRAVTS